MKNQSVKYKFAILALTALLSACASVPMGSTEADGEAKKFVAPTDKAHIYLYRNEAMGSALKIPVTLDGRVMGQTAPNVYFVWDVNPGPHEINCLADSNGVLHLDVKKGQIAYVWQEMKMGMWSGACALNEKSAAEGQKAIVEDCKLAR